MDNPEKPPEPSPEELAEEVTEATAQDPEAMAVGRIFVDQALEQLHPDHRDRIRGMLEGNTTKEIAEEQGVTRRTILEQRQKDMRLLKDWIARGEELRKQDEKEEKEK